MYLAFFLKGLLEKQQTPYGIASDEMNLLHVLFIFYAVQGFYQSTQRYSGFPARDKEIIGVHRGLYKLDEKSWEESRRLAPIPSGFPQQ